MISGKQIELFKRLWKGAGEIALVSHIHPDGDALGSQIHLERFLTAAGKRVRIINCDPPSEFLSFLEFPPGQPELYNSERHDSFLNQVDLLILVDNSAPDRLGRMEPVVVAAAERVLCIDHHPARNAPWKYNILDEEACATTAITHKLGNACGWQLDRAAAEAIYVGLATDTGYFRFNSTNAQAHRIAAELIEIGVEPAQIYQTIYEQHSEAFTRLLGHALVNLRLDAGGAVASVIIPQRLVDELDAEEEDHTEITTTLLEMESVLVAIMFRELTNGQVKVSLRSKGQLDVHRLACEFGGGGHRNASGIVMNSSMDDSVRIVIDRATGMLSAAAADEGS